MKRWLGAVAILLTGAASLSFADYYLIRDILGGSRNQGDPNQPGRGSGTGGPGGPPGAGDFAQRGQPGRGRGNPGAPPPGPGGLPGGTGGQRGTIDTAALAVQAIVHVSIKPAPPVMPGLRGMSSPSTLVTNKWSPVHPIHLFNDNQTIISRHLGRPGQILFAPTNHYKTKKKNAFEHRTPAAMLDLGEYALSHGLVEEFGDLFDGLAKEKPDPSPAAKNLNSALQAYTEVKAALDKDVAGDDSAQAWKSRMSCRDETSKHYSLLYTASVSNPPEVQSRLAALEEHMRAFYYWFALKGQALPMPKEKLVAVMIDQPADFLLEQRSGDDEPLVCDGFFAQRDNVVVFSTQRVDPEFQAFVRQTHPIWQRGFERAKLLDGTEKRKSTTTPDDFARYQTLALLEKALEEEAERAAVSHEGSRQLLVSTGLIPRTVLPPQWLQFGTAAFFETPKGPFMGATAIESQTAVYHGVGGPSWAYAQPFKDLVKRMEAAQSPTLVGTPGGTPPGRGAPGRGAPGPQGPGPAGPPAPGGPGAPGMPQPPASGAASGLRVPATPTLLLRLVVTDGYFNAVLSPNDRQGLFQARTTAWGLTYYLAKSRLPGLKRYFQELAAMPRDLELDSKSKLAAFARAFDIANATQDDIDPAKFEQFAKEWVSTLATIVPPGVDFGLELPNGAGSGGGRPGQPGGPGRGAPGGSGNGNGGNRGAG